MANFNTQFDDKGAVEQLVQLYSDTADSITSQLEEASASALYRRRQILTNIKSELQQLGADTGKWIDINVPKQYKIGMQNAIEQIKALEFLPITTEALFTTINREAVKAMIADTSASFAGALTTVGRSVANIQSKIFQQEIKARLAQGLITGETRKAIQADIKRMIQDQGITALKDKAGRSWSLDRYSEMLARTKLAEARNSGLANKMLENHIDLVEVSSNGSTHPVCEEYEGEILSLSGESEQYESVDSAEAAGLFHPNCQHTLNAVEPDLAEQTFGWDPETQTYEQGVLSDYSGD